jgi:hypothetical protein
MAHFAKLLNNVVIAVVKVENAVLLDDNGIEQEQKGIDFLKSIYSEPLAEWKQTSYNTNGGVHSSGDISKAFRKNYAGIGMIYDPEKDCFYAPKQYENWVFNESVGAFYPPIEVPNTNKVIIDNIEIDLRNLSWNQGQNRWENFNDTISYIWNPIGLTWEISTP